MIHVRTMIMQLIKGETNGIRICRVEGESLVTVVVPRDKLGEVKGLPELPYRGIYYLLDEDRGILSRVYVGQTTQGIGRLDAHKAKKEFWTKAVMFLDNHNHIDRDVLDCLEAKAIDYVRNHGSYETDNTTTPNPRVNPYKEERVEGLHADILFRMEVLGYDLDRTDTARPLGNAVFHTKKNNVHASGRYDKEARRFTVLAGSEVELSRDIIKNRGAIEVRKQLFGDLREKAVLDDDVEFASPSAAAVFVLGGSQNGWTEWVNDEGQTLADVYRGEE